MKKFLTLAGAAGLLLSFAGATTAAPTVRQLDEGRLLVVDYKGKPPFARRVISRDDNPAAFARYQPMVDGASVLVASTTERAGPPGKSLPRQRARVEVLSGEETGFARFEEVGAGEEEARSPRRWRGAPGKGRPLLGN